MKQSSVISILVDNESWILPYAEKLVQNLKSQGYDSILVRRQEDIVQGWICFFLGCIRLVNPIHLNRNEHNLVVHESALPKGRGFAPMAWQILEGSNQIPISLIDASRDEADAGAIWLQDTIYLTGSELAPEWRELQGEKTVEICSRFIGEYKQLKPLAQTESITWYPRRTPLDSELDLDKTLREQLNLLRIVDNDRYPAFIKVYGKKLVIKVECEK
jgi:methionyl-tRNA formyltransferase